MPQAPLDQRSSELFAKLIQADVAAQLPGDALTGPEPMSVLETRYLLGQASVLALSADEWSRFTAYEIVTRLVELSGPGDTGVLRAARAVLARMGNFPGIDYLAKTFQKSAQPPSLYLALEEVSRRSENSVDGHGGKSPSLTDFQYDLFHTLGRTDHASVSAPTSAGKSFVLGLDVIRRFQKGTPQCVVYIAPSRALVRQLAKFIQRSLNSAKLGGVLLRTTPVALPAGTPRRPIVYVLTQERLLSLIHSPEGTVWIDALIVDEAQQISEGSRGIVLQTAIERALQMFPGMGVYFAAPLITNPEVLLETFQLRGAVRRETSVTVGRNLIMVSEVHDQPQAAAFKLKHPSGNFDLGVRELPFRLRDRLADQRAAFARAVTAPGESTIVFANEPDDAEDAARALAQEIVTETSDREVLDLVRFIEQHVHAEYRLAATLRKGVAFHYGKMPGIVRTRVEDLFAQSRIRFMCATSTLLHGVNLPARHLIVERPKSGRLRAMARSEFMNLAGRAGRLGFEFHGNVWCLRPETWDQSVLEGPAQVTIIPALTSMVSDGGTRAEHVLDAPAGLLDKDAETLCGRLFLDTAIQQRPLEQLPYWSPANAAGISHIAQRCSQQRRTLPDDVFVRHFQLSPIRLEQLAAAIREVPNLDDITPIRPRVEGFAKRLGVLFRLCGGTLGGMSKKSCNLHAGIAFAWIYEFPLRKIVAERLKWVRENRDPTADAHAVVRSVSSIIEDGLRFKFVKYLRAFLQLLDVVRVERGLGLQDENGTALPYYLEAGASSRASLILIGLGLSRTTALMLARRLDVPAEADWDDVRNLLLNANLRDLGLHAVCRQEIRDWRGYP